MKFLFRNGYTYRNDGHSQFSVGMGPHAKH